MSFNRVGARENKASSEITGYTIIFGLVIVSIGISLVGGVPLLMDSADAELSENIERTFVSFSKDVDEIFYGVAETREMSTKLRRGSINIGKKTARTVVTVGGTEVRNTTSVVVRYVRDGGGVKYERGAVFRFEGDEAANIRSPEWLVDTDLVYIPSPRVVGSDFIVGNTVILEAQGAPGTFVERIPESDTATVTVEINSNSSEAWVRYFEDIEDNHPSVVNSISGNPSANEAEIQFNIDNTRRFAYVEKPVKVTIDE
jgi:hypothetical protein